jgi:hypothetical protein
MRHGDAVPSQPTALASSRALTRLEPSRELHDALTPLSFLPEHERRVPFAPLPENGRRRRH